MASLESVLADAQRGGMLGARPIPEVIEHARAFVRALAPSDRRVIDLGSGGGVPGLVIAVECPQVELTLVDRRRKRTDFLERATARLGLADRCAVWWCDVEDVVRRLGDPAAGMEPWDAAVSRGFGPPEVTARWARALITQHGRIVISEPPDDQLDRWPAERLERLSLTRMETSPQGVVVLRPSV